jgi:hypothetical protein
VDGLTLSTSAKTLEFKVAFKDAVSKVLGINKSAVVVYSTNVAVDRRRLMEVSDSRKLDGAVPGVSAVYVVMKSGTTAAALATTLSGATASMSNTLSSYGITGTTIEEATVALGNPSTSTPTTTTTASKSSASSGTRSHVAIMISALAVVVIQSVLL